MLASSPNFKQEDVGMSDPIQFKPPNVRLNLPTLPLIPVVVAGGLIALFD
jgi:hypothetical protein